MSTANSKTFSKKRVLVLLYNTFTNDSRVLKECTTLVESGYFVELWAVFNKNLPEKEKINGFVVKRKFRKSEKYKSILFLPKTDIRKFIKVTRRMTLKIPMMILKPFPKSYNFSKKLFNFFEKNFKIVLKKIKIFFIGHRKAGKTSYKNFPFDIIHCNDLLPLPLAVSIKKENPHVKIVYDCHEYEIEAAGVVRDPEKKLHCERLERDHVVDVDRVITVSSSIAEEYKRLYGLKDIAVIRNVPDLSSNIESKEHFRNKFGLKENDIIFLYQGGLIKGFRGIEETIKCFVLLSEEGYTNHHIVFMGYGNLESEIKEYASKYPNIHFHPAVKPHEIPFVSSSADYGIIFVRNHCKSYDLSLPNKLFEYMMCGLTVVVSPLFEIKKLVIEEKMGIATKDFEDASLPEALKLIRNRPTVETKKRIQSLHENKYNWNLEKKILIDLYNNL